MDNSSNSSDFRNKTAAFQAWFLAQPTTALNPHISIKDYRSRDAGRGVVALSDLPTDTQLFTVPRTSILSASTSKLAELLPKEALSDEPWQALILVLIYESLQGESSTWKPYLDVLPDKFDTLMYWSDAELDELQASSVRFKIGKLAADEMMRDKIITCVDAYEDIFYRPDAKRLNPAEMGELGHRMASIVMAYAFDLEHDKSEEAGEDGYATEDDEAILPKGMIPMADMLNADADHNARLFSEADNLVMKTTRAIKKGEQIFNDYGALPRSDVLRRYGYITPGYAQYDVVEISHRAVVDVVQEYRTLSGHLLTARIDYLKNEFEVDEGYDIHWVRQDDDDHQNQEEDYPLHHLYLGRVQISDELLRLLETLLTPPNEFENIDPLSQALQRSRFVDIRIVVGRLVVARLQQYATSLAEDQQLLKQHQQLLKQQQQQQQPGLLSKRKRMAVEVRMGEKKILLEARRMFTMHDPPEQEDELPVRKKHRG